jgi:heavy metal sensor kinase
MSSASPPFDESDGASSAALPSLQNSEFAPVTSHTHESPHSKPRFRLHESLRGQLALWQAGLLAITLVLLAVFTDVVLRQFLNSQADAGLRRYAETIALEVGTIVSRYDAENPGKSLEKDPNRVQTYQTFVNNSDLQSMGRYIQVLDPTNHVVAYSDALRTTQLPPSPTALLNGLEHRSTIETCTNLGQYPIRIVTVPVLVGDKVPYLVQVGASVEGVEDALWRASIVLLVLTPSVIIIALVGGWLLVGRALKPVDEMTKAALSIESSRLDMRLTPAVTDNEIGRLAGALNEMIARLDRSFRQIERFSADASHELKTPLTTIRGEAEVALMADQTSEEHRKTLRSIIEETERLSSIVNNLLLLSRADADQVRLKQEPVLLHDVAMAAYERMASLAHRKHINLDIGAMEEVTISGDALWLQQLITNLLHNAINYTPSGGDVTLILTREDAADYDLQAASCVCVSIEDTGPGIAPEHLPHLFDRFYRVDSGRSRDQGGTGLGLNIAKWIAESHNGKILVRSTVGKGTTFKVALPVESTMQPLGMTNALRQQIIR